MRGLFALASIALVAAACGDSTETTSTAPATASTAATAATTTPATASVLTFTGSDCIGSGSDTMSAGVVTITLKNESSTEMAVVFLELVDVTWEEIVAVSGLFPPATSWPPPGAFPLPPEEALVSSARVVDSNAEVVHTVAFNRAGQYGTVCWPLDGSPAVLGAPLTVA